MTMQLRGKGVYTWDAVRQVESDVPSIDAYGAIPFNTEMRYSSQVVDNPLLGYFLIAYAQPRYEWDSVTLFANRDETNMQAFLQFEPGDQIQLTDTMTAIASEVGSAPFSPRIQGYEAEILPGQRVRWKFATKNGGA
jgi:hypothetical protein